MLPPDAREVRFRVLQKLVEVGTLVEPLPMQASDCRMPRIRSRNRPRTCLRAGTVITGASKIEQLKDNLGAMDVIAKLSPDVMVRIDKATKLLAN